MKAPTFMILGSGKSGTTSLARYLAQHPDVCLSEPKEPWFFDTWEYHEGLDHYLRTYYPHRGDEAAVGEASSQNLFVPFVPPRILDTVPGARFVVLLRNPVDRAYSDWWMRYTSGAEPLPFDEAVARNLEDLEQEERFEGDAGRERWYERIRADKENRVAHRTYLDYGHYDEQLARYLETFHEDQFLVVFLDQLKERPLGVVQSVYQHIGVDPAFEPPDLSPRNESFNHPLARTVFEWASTTRAWSVLPDPVEEQVRETLLEVGRGLGSKPTMEPGMRTLLHDHFRPHIRNLSTILRWDQPIWTEDGYHGPPAPAPYGDDPPGRLDTAQHPLLVPS